MGPCVSAGLKQSLRLQQIYLQVTICKAAGSIGGYRPSNPEQLGPPCHRPWLSCCLSDILEWCTLHCNETPRW